MVLLLSPKIRTSRSQGLSILCLDKSKKAGSGPEQENYISFTMSDVKFNKLLDRVSEKIAVTELPRLKRWCRGKMSTPDGNNINTVWDLLLDLIKCNNLGPDKLEVLKDLLEDMKGGKSLLNDVNKFEEIRKEKMSGIVPSLKSFAGNVGSGLVSGAKNATGKLVGAVNIQTTLRNAAGILVVVSAGLVVYHAETLQDYMNAFSNYALPAGNFLRTIGEKCLLFTVQAETPSALETLWKEYMAGTLQKRLQEFLVTEELKEFKREEDLEVTIYIDNQEYKDALLDLLIKESNVNLEKHPQKGCRRKSDSDLHIKPAETDVTDMRLRQVERRLLLERERRRQIESENESEKAAVSEGESTGDAIYAAAAPETMTGMESGPSGLVEDTPDELNYSRICHIIYKLIPEGLRKIFKQEWDFRYKIFHGEWKDTPQNGRDLYALESHKSRSKNASYFMIMQNGNTEEWDLSCLFFVMLFSESIGATLSQVVKLPIDDLRQVRNSIAHLREPSLTDVEFHNYKDRVLHAFTSLGLSMSDVEAVKSQRSFQTPELKLVEKPVDDATEKLKVEAAPSITEEHKGLSHEVSSKVEPFFSVTFKPFNQIIERPSRIVEKMKEIDTGNGLVTIYFSESS